uniref:IBB domain-containing protein n=2 Tax=Bursaphelenchus xylophilus TaxID=6326 RepID=A0A1I7S652_BURXY
MNSNRFSQSCYARVSASAERREEKKRRRQEMAQLLVERKRLKTLEDNGNVKVPQDDQKFEVSSGSNVLENVTNRTPMRTSNSRTRGHVFSQKDNDENSDITVPQDEENFGVSSGSNVLGNKPHHEYVLQVPKSTGRGSHRQSPRTKIGEFTIKIK